MSGSGDFKAFSTNKSDELVMIFKHFAKVVEWTESEDKKSDGLYDRIVEESASVYEYLSNLGDLANSKLQTLKFDPRVILEASRIAPSASERSKSMLLAEQETLINHLEDFIHRPSLVVKLMKRLLKAIARCIKEHELRIFNIKEKVYMARIGLESEMTEEFMNFVHNKIPAVGVRELNKLVEPGNSSQPQIDSNTIDENDTDQIEINVK